MGRAAAGLRWLKIGNVMPPSGCDVVGDVVSVHNIWPEHSQCCPSECDDRMSSTQYRSIKLLYNCPIRCCRRSLNDESVCQQ